jgi:hypothetical protein
MTSRLFPVEVVCIPDLENLEILPQRISGIIGTKTDGESDIKGILDTKIPAKNSMLDNEAQIATQQNESCGRCSEMQIL